jgi:membrane protease YdiL (CAAX protease family)
VLISSFLFGLAHFNIYSISLGISSIFLALIYIKTQTLIVPIIFHGLHNTMVLISHIISSISYPNTSVDVSLNTL